MKRKKIFVCLLVVLCLACLPVMLSLPTSAEGEADYRTSANSNYSIIKNFSLTQSRNGQYAAFSDVKGTFYGTASDFNTGWLYESKFYDLRIPLFNRMVGDFSIVCQFIQENYNDVIDSSINSISPLDYDVISFVFTDLNDPTNVLEFRLTESGWYTANITLIYKGQSYYQLNYWGWSLGGKGNYNTDNKAFSFKFSDLYNSYKDTFLTNFYGFEEYSVSFSFIQNSCRNTDATKKLLIYELCGQNLGPETMVNSAGPIFDFNVINGVVGKSYTLPEVTKSFDVIDGFLTDNCEYAVTGPNGEDIELDSRSFVPAAAGRYTAIITASDTEGTTNSMSKQFEVLESYPEAVFTFTNHYKEEYATDTPLAIILPYSVYSNILKGDISYGIELYGGDQLLKSFGKNDPDLTYVLRDAGTYSVKYITAEEYGYRSIYEESFEVVQKPYIPDIGDVIVGVGQVYYPQWLYSTYMGQRKLMNMEIRDPDGNVITLDSNDSFTADILGDYTISYSVEFGSVTAQIQQIVQCKVIASSVFSSLIGIDEIRFNQDTTFYSENGNGMELYSSAGGQATTRVFDLAKHDTTSLIKFQGVNRQKLGTIQQMSVYLVDANDSSNYVAITYWQSPWAPNVVYLTFYYRTRNNVLIGCNPSGDEGRENYGTSYLNRPLSKSTGTYLGCPQYGVTLSGGMTGMKIHSFEFDYKTGTFYSFDTPLFSILDGECVGYTRLWKGFSSTNAYIRITFDIDNGGSCALNVTELLGQSLSGSDIDDKEAPFITIVKNSYINDEESLPMAVVGKPYPVPSFDAYDFFAGVKNVIVRVIDNETGLAVPLKKGLFTPKATGMYSLYCYAEDKLGNISRKFIDLTVVEDGENFSSSWESEPEAAYAGDLYTIPKIVVEGRLSNLVISETITCGSRTIDPQTRKIQLDSLASIVINIVATDYIGNVFEREYTIPVNAKETPVLYISSGMPTSVKLNSSFTVPSFDAIDFNHEEGESGYRPEKWITVNGTRFDTLSIDVTESLVSGGKLVIIYHAGSGDKVASSKEYVVHVINPYYIGDYFILSDGVSVEYERIATVFKATKNGTFKVANNLSINKLIFKFGMLADYNPSAFTIRIEDFENEDISILLTFMPFNNQSSHMYLNDGTTPAVVDGSFFIEQQYFYVYYNVKSHIIADVYGNLIARIDKTEKGADFEGFPSGSVRITFGLEHNGENLAAVRFYQISNQQIVNTYRNGQYVQFRDNVSPLLSFERPMSNEKVSIGHAYTLPVFKAYDFCSTDFRVYVTLTSPSGRKLVDKVENAGGSHILDEYGSYVLTYEIEEGGETYTSTYYIEVVDEISPAVSVNGSKEISIKVGESVTVPEATYSDSQTSAQLYVLLYKDAKATVVSIGQQIRFDEAGDYALRYYVVDANYNIAEAIVKIKVK